MLDVIRWNADLINHYDQAGPRYTSYPTAHQFNGNVGPFDLLHALRGNRRNNLPLSLYVHLPFCANACHYCECNKVITKDRGRALPYLEHMEHEIRMIAGQLGPDRVVEKLHFGGGTPTFLSHADLRRLMANLGKHFSLQGDGHGDFSIEIDPRHADWPTMGLLRELGFNRVSIGINDLDPGVQRATNRVQTRKQTQTIVEAARTLQYRSIGIDLIYGLPLQTPDSFAITVQAVIALQPERVSVLNFIHQPTRYTPQRHINVTDLPTAATKLAMLQHSVERLTDAGYRYIGMGHFALPDDELAMAQEDGTLHRNLHGYTTYDCDLIGLGVSAVSQVGDLYCQNDSDISRYEQLLAQGQLPTMRGLRCNKDDRIRREVIQRLLCDFELQFNTIENAPQIDFKDYFRTSWPTLQRMANDGLIQLDDHSLVILPAGRLLASAICAQFDRYRVGYTGQHCPRNS